MNDEGKYVLAYGPGADLATDTPQPIKIEMGASKPDGEDGVVSTDYAITDNGYITVRYSDGSFASIGQLALATFPNEKGLMKTGNGNYTVAPASGEPAYNVSGAAGFGTVRGGTTEASNVDLSAEFVDLMLYQKGFQGNSKAVKVSDDVLNDIINLIR
ncbi:Flagellar hook protein FlgE [compost metagenome]